MGNIELLQLQDNCLVAIGKCPQGRQGLTVFSDRDILLGIVKEKKVLDYLCKNETLFSLGYDKYLSKEVYNILIRHKSEMILSHLRD